MQEACAPFHNHTQYKSRTYPAYNPMHIAHTLMHAQFSARIHTQSYAHLTYQRIQSYGHRACIHAQNSRHSLMHTYPHSTHPYYMHTFVRIAQILTQHHTAAHMTCAHSTNTVYILHACLPINNTHTLACTCEHIHKTLDCRLEQLVDLVWGWKSRHLGIVVPMYL